ncbi:MAG: hypothetical protein O3B42_07400 [Actinomycetota bacterium]|nr:hypothetical protein [Actinomycetota bacterium]
MSTLLVALGSLVALAIAATLVHLALSWMERRGWIWYRTPKRPKPISLGFVEEIYEPLIQDVIEQHMTEATEADQTESGEEEDLSSDP